MDGEEVRISKISGCALPAPVKIQQRDRDYLSKLALYQRTKIAKKYKGFVAEDHGDDSRHYQMLAKVASRENLRTTTGPGWHNASPRVSGL